MSDRIEYRRLRAPREDGGILMEPPLQTVVELAHAPPRWQSAGDYDVQGRSLGALAEQARTQLVQAALHYTRQYREANVTRSSDRIVLAGHQPQLFHPGVWFKNFVLSAVARRADAVAINLVIDSDTIKSATLRVPGGTISQPRVEMLAYDQQTQPIAYEERRIVDRAVFENFGRRAGNILAPLVPNSLLETFWPLVVERSHENSNLGTCLAQARHQLEGQWGAETLEVPQSEICKLEAFYWFASHLLAHLPRFWEVYNTAVDEFRRANHVRSSAHPVPDLQASGDWLEAPLWIWSQSHPQRRALFVRHRGDQLLLSDRDQLELPLSISPESDASAAVEQIAALASRGIKLRTRALTTTMFARLMLGRTFLHGIGGAKYDQVTDVLIARFFGIEPPPYMTVTATLRLPLEHHGSSAAGGDALARELRDLEYHPERHLEPSVEGQVDELIRDKQRWIRTPQTRENARARCVGIRRVNEALQPLVEPMRRRLIDERRRAVEAVRSESILSSREYAFCLYPEDALRRLISRADGTR